MSDYYPIGKPGEPWGSAEKQAWFESQSVQRSYEAEVLAKVRALGDPFEVFAYGALSLDADRYPLLAVRLPAARPDLPWVFITGGVHGYETSGVQGALAFLADHALDFRDRANLLVAPCVSPWGYEVINRWNPNAVDPNRSFYPRSPSEEASAVMSLVGDHDVDFVMHIDLHETTDTDETEFRPALAARDGKTLAPGIIPDGFYTVGDTDNPCAEFQAAIIAGVSAVTHIAPADENGQIIEADATQPGVINYPFTELGLCAGVSGARFTTTTEVYPDSPTATPEICIDAQVAAVRAGAEYALAASPR